MDILTASVFAAAMVVGIGTIAPAIAQGIAINGAVHGISRQPEASGTIGTNLIIGLAFAESLTIYALVVALVLLFANPIAKSAKAEKDAQAEVEVLKLKIQKIELQTRLDALQKTGAPAEAK
jgi:F-type H+-transporting ATPase subunit c